MQGHTQKIDTSLGGSDSAPASPVTIGKYEIIEPIGEGGFGMVYKGFDPFIKRHVAIKTCTSPDQELRQRYYREAEIAGRLDHPNIVRIFDFGTQDGTPFLVQEFLAGGDLDRKIEDRQFVPVPERLLYLIHIARGLAYAHDQGIIHRDIKPANIRILEDGSAKIMDFGVAMLQNAETRLTKDGMAVGTAAYLAPEQVDGNTPDHRSDIFSYGVLAYELLTGDRPFEQDSISATLYSILHDDPKPITLPIHLCPQSLQRLIERCMDKDPNQRPNHFAEVLESLDRIRTDLRSTDPARDFASDLRNTTSQTSAAPKSKSFAPPQKHGWTPPSIRMQRRRRWSRVLVPVVLLAALATAYGVFANQELLPWGDAPRQDAIHTATFKDPDANDTVLPQPPAAVEADGSTTPPMDSKSAGSLAAENQPSVAAASEPTDSGSEPVAEAEPPPPPVVEKATLYLDRGWHKGIRASIDKGNAMGLSRNRSFELEPGDHVVRYSLETAAYSTAETVRVHLASGEERRLDNPIRRPGHLSVQASLGSPQGIVRVDGKPVGPSPLRGIVLPPGRHQLQVASVNDPTTPLADATVDIRSQRETVITFDLTGQRELAIRYRDNSP